MPADTHDRAEGATPLDPDERDGLIPTYIATRDDLNEAEQANIAAAALDLRRRGLSTDQVLDEPFVRSLHKAIYRDVWKWAGTYRTTERNVGVDPRMIAIEVRNLMDDAAHWVAPDCAWLTRDPAV